MIPPLRGVVKKMAGRGMEERNNNNTLIGLALGFGVLLLAWFFADLLDSKAGERVAAFGAVVGGIIGAGGAVFAVYLTLARQRNDDSAKVRAAVRTEVTTFAKYVIGALNVCQQIARGLPIPMADAPYITKSLVDPVVYPAVADRIGLLPRAQQTIEFYQRIAEAKAMTEAMRNKVASLTQAQSAMQNIQRSNALVVADSLITALQLSRSIVGNDDPTRTDMDLHVQGVVTKQIDDSLVAAQKVFPDAESWEGWGINA
jgi:hypothetical protein